MIGELTNHLWQSTFYAIAAGMLALAFRKNRAQIRYWIWLSASLKFLVPFSLLMSLGSHFAWAPAAKTVATQAVSLTILQITQPFPDTLSSVPSIPHNTDWPLIAVLGVWVCGFGAIALIRFRDWLGIRAAVRSSRPLDIRAAVEVRSSASLLEPGVVGLDVFGVSRPVLLLPEGIVDRLSPAQLEAVFAHELCHIRRRDNLTAALHMIVEAVFWFHPLVWWIGARLVEERERACDEEVLRLGNDPQVYAQGILNVCKFYVESPVRCVSGVTGSDLKKRIHRIMKEHFGVGLSARKKLLLVTAGVLALAVPLVVGVLRLQAQVPQWQIDAGGKMAFDVTSVKQNTASPSPSTQNTNVGLGPMDDFHPTGGLLSATNYPLSQYILFAYKPTPEQFEAAKSQLPKWANTNRYDIQARASGNPTKDQFRLMMQALLADRFKLSIHFETEQRPVFALVLEKTGKWGPQLQPHPEDWPCSNSVPDPLVTVACGVVTGVQSRVPGRVRAEGRNVPVAMLAAALDIPKLTGIDRPVFNRTGLNGRCDFAIEWTPEADGPISPSSTVQPDESGPTFTEALKDQLGLKLVPQMGPVAVLVIDHVEEPSPN